LLNPATGTPLTTMTKLAILEYLLEELVCPKVVGLSKG
jgi:hypothetical protein